MKAATVASQGAEIQITDIVVPQPSDEQILVKSIYAPVNPVDSYMIQTGILVLDWPLVAGCDAGGVVVKAGKNAISALGNPFKEGDQVFGCTRLGCAGYATFEEYFLMDSKLTYAVPKSLELVQASTLGVGLCTAALGIFQGLNIKVPDPKNLPTPKDEWALVLGGASSVGKMAFQVLKACGYKVIVSVSAKSFDLVKSLGADECIDYHQPEEDIIAGILKKTGGKMYRAFDAMGQHIDFSVPLFKAVEAKDKWFSTTNDWTPLPQFESFHPSCVRLGPIGREDATELNRDLVSYVPFLSALLECGKILPSEYTIIGKTGVESVAEAYAFQSSGKGGSKKVVVKISDE